MHLLLSMPGGAEWILVLGGIFLIALPFWVIFDILKSDFKQPDKKLPWMLLVIFLPLIGSLLYYFIGENQKKAKP